MASTTNSSVQTRTVTADYVAAEFPQQSKLVGSGAVRVDPNPPFKGIGGGGYVFNIPHYYEFTTADVVPDIDDTAGTRNAVTTYQDVGIVTYRISSMSVKDTAITFAGADIEGEIVRQIPNYWAKRTDIALYNVVKGAFASAMSGAQFVGQLNQPFTRRSVVDTIGLSCVGSNWEKFRIYLMRSKQFGQAIDDGIVNYVNAGNFGERLLNTGDVPTIFGRQVVVDDNIVETDGSLYLVQPQALYLAFQKDFGIERERRPDLGGGLTTYWMTACYLPFLHGLTFAGTSTAYPTNTTLATGASWTLTQTTDYMYNKAVKLVAVNP
jgi:hypothetical protein